MSSSSWLVSLRGTAGRIVGRRRVLKRYGFGMPCVADDLRHAVPGRLGAEAAAEVVQQSGNLIVIHAVGETRHDGAVFSADWSNACKNDVGGIARVRRAQR